jgi:hypothetical protein
MISSGCEKFLVSHPTLPNKVAARSKVWAIFIRTGIVPSNPTRFIYVCVRLFYVCVVLCVGRGFATGWSPVKGVLIWIKKLKERPKSSRAVKPCIDTYTQHCRYGNLNLRLLLVSRGFVAALFDTFEKRMGKNTVPSRSSVQCLWDRCRICAAFQLSGIGISCFVPTLLVLPKIDIKFELLDGNPPPLPPAQLAYTTLQGGCSWIWFQQMNAVTW